MPEGWRIDKKRQCEKYGSLPYLCEIFVLDNCVRANSVVIFGTKDKVLYTHITLSFIIVNNYMRCMLENRITACSKNQVPLIWVVLKWGKKKCVWVCSTLSLQEQKADGSALYPYFAEAKWERSCCFVRCQCKLLSMMWKLPNICYHWSEI